MANKILPYNPDLKILARELRKNGTLSEILLWNQLKRKKLIRSQIMEIPYKEEFITKKMIFHGKW